MPYQLAEFERTCCAIPDALRRNPGRLCTLRNHFLSRASKMANRFMPLAEATKGLDPVWRTSTEESEQAAAVYECLSHHGLINWGVIDDHPAMVAPGRAPPFPQCVPCPKPARRARRRRGGAGGRRRRRGGGARRRCRRPAARRRRRRGRGGAGGGASAATARPLGLRDRGARADRRARAHDVGRRRRGRLGSDGRHRSDGQPGRCALPPDAVADARDRPALPPLLS